MGTAPSLLAKALFPIDLAEHDDQAEHGELERDPDRVGEAAAEGVAETRFADMMGREGVDRIGDDAAGEEGGGEGEQAHFGQPGGFEELGRRKRRQREKAEAEDRIALAPPKGLA